MERYSVFGSLIAQEGKGEMLQNYLLQAAEGMEEVDDCYCYIVGINDEEPDAVYVFEVWENEAAHKASLQLEFFRHLIAEALPIIADMTGHPSLTIIGGKAEF